MPLHSSWFLQDHIILVKAVGAIRDDEVMPLDQKLIQMIESVSTPRVHLFYDSTEQTAQASIMAMSKMKVPFHKRMGWYVAIGAQNRLQTMINALVGQIFRLRTKAVKTQAEAVQFIIGVDETLGEKLKAVQVEDRVKEK